MANSRYNKPERKFENDPTPGFSVPLTFAANQVLAGPTSGAAATPTVRALVPADFPAATASARGIVKLAGQLGGSADLPDVRGIRETSGPTLLTIGSIPDGYLLKRSGSTVIGYADSTPSSFMGETSVTGSAATSMQITGLDLSVDQEYDIRAEFKNANAGSVTFYLEVNGDATTTNYYRQTIGGDNTALGGLRANNPIIKASAPATQILTLRGRMSLDFAGRAKFQGTTTLGTSASNIEHVAWAWIHNSVSNVTTIEIVAATASSIAIGSKMKVFKVTGGTA